MRVFVICRDRVTYARQCVEAMLDARLDVVVVDHGSTWRPMVRYLGYLEWLSGPHIDVERNGDLRPRDLWRETIPGYVGPNERFLVTDCDVVPDSACPRDWVSKMDIALDNCPSAVKVGLSLRTDDLPERYEHAERVRRWERQYQTNGPHQLPNGVHVFHASVDTTLAMYRRLEDFAIDPAIRLAPPYQARHLSWYQDSANPMAEELHYRERALSGSSHWLSPVAWEGVP